MLNLNNKIRKIFIIILIVLGIFQINSLAVVKPTTDFYVNDYANLLSSDTKNYIISTNKNLYKQTGAQIVVVTIPSLENSSLEEYATKLFREFGIGDKNRNNGVLLLLALKERKFRVEVGYGLEGVLPDAKTGRIQDEYIIPYLKQDNWNDGIRNGFNAILSVVAKEYNVEVGAEEVKVSNIEPMANSISAVIIIVLVISPILGIILINKNKKQKIVISVIYSIIITIVFYIVFKQIHIALVLTMFSLVALLTRISGIGGRFSSHGGSSGGFSGGGSSGGAGSSGGGGSSRSF